ncbi:MAG: hypothetical protein LBM69_05810 [Lachnospiraceae bacterium]|jgi:hypothetical protein|nr:hypothetical protein [Lachnospiraceae bacterium]
MLFAVIGIGVGFLTLAILARKEPIQKEKGKYPVAFLKMASFLYRKTKLRSLQPKEVEKCLSLLHPGESLSDVRTEFYIRKIALSLLLLFVGTLFAILVKVQAEQSRILTQENTLIRQEYGDGKKKLTLKAHIGEDYAEEWKVILPIKEYTEQEAEEAVAVFWSILCNEILASNESIQEVNKDLNLVTQIEGYPFYVKWTSSRSDLIQNDGKLKPITQIQTVLLTAHITYEPPTEEIIQSDIEKEPRNGDSQSELVLASWEYELSITVCPPFYSQEEQLSHQLYESIISSEKDTAQQREWELPSVLEDQKIVWEEIPEDDSYLFMGIAIIVAGCVYFLSDKDLQKKIKVRAQCLKDTYPQIVNKLVMYLSAGMTIRSAYIKIAQDYQAQKEQSQVVHPAYEEMVYTYHEIMTGTPEAKAYEHFGRRSGLPEYVKLSALLAQNVKKGNSSLLARLKEEAMGSMEERFHRRTKLGEEATTKLLLPMMMMLGIVMLLVMIPAFTSLNG